MMQNNPMGIIMQYMHNGADVKTALSQAAQQYPNMFPPQQVSLAMSVLSKPQNNRRQFIANMARERGVDLDSYMAKIRQQMR